MKIESVVVGPFQVNCYLIKGEDNQTIIIDPGFAADRILNALAEDEVAVYLATHGHADHIGAWRELESQKAAPGGLQAADCGWAFGPKNAIDGFYPVPERPAELARQLEDGSEWEDAGLHYRVIATPGHSPGCVCFHFPDEKVLFSGDTLFKNGVGRTDLPGSDSRQLKESLKQLSRLPPDTLVYPGHGPSTSIGEERENNYFV